MFQYYLFNMNQYSKSSKQYIQFNICQYFSILHANSIFFNIHRYCRWIPGGSLSFGIKFGLERAAPPHLGAIHGRRLSKPSPPMRLAGLNPHRREATRSRRALGQGPQALTPPRRGPSTPADSEECQWTTIG